MNLKKTLGNAATNVLLEFFGEVPSHVKCTACTGYSISKIIYLVEDLETGNITHKSTEKQIKDLK